MGSCKDQGTETCFHIFGFVINDFIELIAANRSSASVAEEQPVDIPGSVLLTVSSETFNQSEPFFYLSRTELVRMTSDKYRAFLSIRPSGCSSERLLAGNAASGSAESWEIKPAASSVGSSDL